MEFKDKLGQIVHYYGLNMSSFAKKVNIGKTLLAKYVNQGSQPSYANIVSILNAFPEVSAEWLLRGVGPMLLKGEGTPDAQSIQEMADKAVESSIEIAKDITEVKLDFYKKDNNRLEIEMQELKNKVKFLEERNIILQNKLLGL